MHMVCPQCYAKMKVIIMDNVEAIKRIEDHIRVHHIAERPHIFYLNTAFNIAIEALKKRVPVEHHHTVVRKCKLIDEDIRLSICPSCLGVILTSAEEFPKFCTWCGQAIDWSDMN